MSATKGIQANKELVRACTQTVFNIIALGVYPPPWLAGR